MERLFSGEPAVGVTDNSACGPVRAAREAASKVMENPDDYDARAEIMWVGTLAHNGLAGCGLGVPGLRDGDWTCHVLEHELSALDTKITHDAGLAVIFPAWLRYAWREHPERFLEFSAQAFGVEPVDSDADELDVEVTPSRQSSTRSKRPSTSCRISTSRWECRARYRSSESPRTISKR